MTKPSLLVAAIVCFAGLAAALPFYQRSGDNAPPKEGKELDGMVPPPPFVGYRVQESSPSISHSQERARTTIGKVARPQPAVLKIRKKSDGGSEKASGHRDPQVIDEDPPVLANSYQEAVATERPKRFAGLRRTKSIGEPTSRASAQPEN